MTKHILVTNDDGVMAPGLLALVQEMRKLGKVTVMAPDRNWSGSGHVKTLDRALRVKEVRLADGTQAFASDGAPSDCVALATLGYFERANRYRRLRHQRGRKSRSRCHLLWNGNRRDGSCDRGRAWRGSIA